MRPLKLLPSALAFGAASLLASGARASTDCTTLPNPVYVAGSTAIGPVLNTISKFLAIQSPPVTVVYDPSGSCSGVATMVNGTPLSSGAKTGVFSYYDASGNAQTCDIAPPDGGVSTTMANLVLSDVFAETCQTLANGLPSGVTPSAGPVQAMTFAVPAMSSQNAISREAAYLVYGLGAQSGIKFWSDVMSMYQRGPTSGTQTMIAQAIGVGPTVWWGVTPSGTAGMIASLTMANTKLNGNAIGILGAADLDPLRRAATGSNPVAIKELAYQHTGQHCGYLPDSSPSSFDKKNVRNGHYFIWGQLHLYLLPNGSSTAQTNAQTIVKYLTGTTAAGSLDVIASEALAGLVPTCAMRVQRSKEVGPMTPYSPTTPCGCYYEFVANGSTTCTPCKSDSDCTSIGGTCPAWPGGSWCEAP